MPSCVLLWRQAHWDSSLAVLNSGPLKVRMGEVMHL